MEMYPNQAQISQPWYMQPWQTPVNGPQTPNMPYLGNRQGNNPQTAQPGFKVCPVASYDEAKAIPTDFMGNTIIMPDITHNYIYTKVFNPNTGGSMLGAFKAVQLPEMGITPEPEVPSSAAYDAKSEIDKLQMEIAHIKQELGIESKKEEN